MLFIMSFWIFFIIDTFIVLFSFSIFICLWMSIMLLSIFMLNSKLDFYMTWNFVTAKYLDAYFFSLGVLFTVCLIFKLLLLLYFSCLNFVTFDLCKVIGMQWLWSFIINSDNMFSNMLLESDYYMGDLSILQCNNVIIFLSLVFYKLWITSIDVIHSFTLPSLGMKMDAMPGSCNELQLFSLIDGSIYGQCSELCGVLHGFMPMNIIFI